MGTGTGSGPNTRGLPLLIPTHPWRLAMQYHLLVSTDCCISVANTGLRTSSFSPIMMVMFYDNIWALGTPQGPDIVICRCTNSFVIPRCPVAPDAWFTDMVFGRNIRPIGKPIVYCRIQV